MNVPMADLPAQHQELRAELSAAFEQVMDKCQFGLGANVAGLEAEIAALCGARHGLGVNSGIYPTSPVSQYAVIGVGNNFAVTVPAVTESIINIPAGGGAT